jgi:hypothetical protein
LCAAALTFAVASSACGASGAPQSPADQSFLSAVHAAAPDVATYRNDTELVRLGHAVCDDFEGHASYEAIADRLALEEGSDPMPSQDLGAVISSAVAAFCPSYEGQVSEGAAWPTHLVTKVTIRGPNATWVPGARTTSSNGLRRCHRAAPGG